MSGTSVIYKEHTNRWRAQKHQNRTSQLWKKVARGKDQTMRQSTSVYPSCLLSGVEAGSGIVTVCECFPSPHQDP